MYFCEQSLAGHFRSSVQNFHVTALPLHLIANYAPILAPAHNIRDFMVFFIHHSFIVFYFSTNFYPFPHFFLLYFFPFITNKCVCLPILKHSQLLIRYRVLFVNDVFKMDPNKFYIS